MKQVLLVEDDSFLIKNNKINFIVSYEEGLYLRFDKETRTGSLSLPIELKYLNGEKALQDVYWKLPADLARRGLILASVDFTDHNINMILISSDAKPVSFEYGETLLIGNIVEEVRTIGVAKHHAEAYRKIVR